MRSNEINWRDCIGVCTDGAAAMTGRQSRVVQRIKQVAPLAVSTHCFLHREALPTKEMEPSLHGVLVVAVKIVNFVKARATNSRLFTVLCVEVGADYHTLLMHTDVRWLSRGRVLMRLFSLKSCVTFLRTRDQTLQNFWMMTNGSLNSATFQIYSVK